MGRQLLGADAQSQLFKQTGTAAAASRPRAERLRKRRSPAYLEALRGLDAGGEIVDSARLAALREAISAEFPEAEALPVGWVAKCYLGPPFEVHTLDPTGEIARHFKGSEALPGVLERARSLARGGRYLFIEVYADKLVAVGGDGATSVIEA